MATGADGGRMDIKTIDKAVGVFLLSAVVGLALGVGVNWYKKKIPAPVVVEPVVVAPTPPPPVVTPQTDDEYLCEVYHRTPVKRDGAGDFTWKDKEAAKRAGMEVCVYVVGGLNPDFKKKLAIFGHAADEKKIEWSLLSAFRDDYRQRIASGTKAREKNSMHGGSRATKGYGDGRAADITVKNGPIFPLFSLVDGFGKSIGIDRPYKGFDPGHIQMGSRTPAPSRKKVKVRKTPAEGNEYRPPAREKPQRYSGDRYDSFNNGRSEGFTSQSPSGGHR